MKKTDKILVLGGNGMVGSSIVRTLKEQGYSEVLDPPRVTLDLSNQSETDNYIYAFKPDYVFLAAAKVGGIHANNSYPAEFIGDNLLIQTNVISACHANRVKKLMFLGSVCIYPKYASVPVQEDSLLTGELEPTNQWYAIAKIAGLKMCQAYRRQYGCDFVSVMPCNLYGIKDNFHPDNAHVIPALIRRFSEAKKEGAEEVVCWGTGKARREFMYVDDMADACIFLMENYSEEQIINIGGGEDYSIREIVEQISELVEYKGKIVWDTTKPDGTPKRLLDSSRLFKMGWKPKTSLREGLIKSIEWYKENVVKKD